MARTTTGPAIVDKLPGSQRAKDRLKAILEVLGGECSIGVACETLGIKDARFHTMRQEALEGAIEALEKGTPGRKKQAAPVTSEERVRQLEQELEEAKLKLLVAETKIGVAALTDDSTPLAFEQRAKGGGLQDSTQIAS